MTTPDTSLAAQRLALRSQLVEQRQRISHVLGPAPESNNVFPRSMTMRLITQNPDVALKVVSQVGMLLFGSRIFRSLNNALAVSKVVRSVVLNPRKS